MLQILQMCVFRRRLHAWTGARILSWRALDAGKMHPFAFMI